MEPVVPAPRLADAQRLEVLASIDFDDPELRRRLDEIVERTANHLDFPISLVTLLSHVTQFVVGSHGVPSWVRQAEGTPVEWSFCAEVVTSGEAQMIADLAKHDDHSTNPLVTVDGARSYAGVPLVIDGQVLGTHCVVGEVERSFTEAELEELQRNAQAVTALLQQFRRGTPA